MNFVSKKRGQVTRIDFQQDRINGYMTDFTIIIKGETETKKFKVDRIVLGSCSTYFDELFEADCSLTEADLTSTYTVEDIDNLIQFSYGFDISINATNVAAYCKLAYGFQIWSLKSRIAMFLIDYIKKFPLTDFYNLMNQYDMPVLRRSLLNYLGRNFYDIRNNALVARHLPNLTFEEMLAVVSSDSLPKVEEYEILVYIEKWVLHDEVARIQHLSRLLEEIRHGTATSIVKDIVRLLLASKMKTQPYAGRVYELIGRCLTAGAVSDAPNFSRKRNWDWKLVAITTDGLMHCNGVNNFLVFKTTKNPLVFHNNPDRKIHITCDGLTANLNNLTISTPVTEGIAFNVPDGSAATVTETIETIVKQRLLVNEKGSLHIIDDRNEMSVYDSQSNKMARFAIKFEAMASKVFLECGDLLEIGGKGDGSEYKRVRRYNFKRAEWTEQAQLPREVMLGQATLADDDAVYLVGGAARNSSNQHESLASCVRYRDGAWTEMAAMKRSRKYHHVYACDGRLYAIGGRETTPDGKSSLCPDNEYYDIAGDTWTTFELSVGGKQQFVDVQCEAYSKAEKCVYYYVARDRKVFKIDLATLAVSECSDPNFNSDKLNVHLAIVYMKIY